MVKVKLVDRRNGRPSMRALADAVESTTTTISEMMYGTRDTKPELLRKVADALEVSINDVVLWVGRSPFTAEQFEPHPDVDLLTIDEQRAINELIRVIAAPRKPRRRIEDATSIAEALEIRGEQEAHGRSLKVSRKSRAVMPERDPGLPDR